jgi:hypothetical protein
MCETLKEKEKEKKKRKKKSLNIPYNINFTYFSKDIIGAERF